jgi:hypothetical protein
VEGVFSEVRFHERELDAGSSVRTVRYVHATLHKALKQAVMDGL